MFMEEVAQFGSQFLSPAQSNLLTSLQVSDRRRFIHLGELFHGLYQIIIRQSHTFPSNEIPARTPHFLVSRSSVGKAQHQFCIRKSKILTQISYKESICNVVRKSQFRVMANT